MSASSDSLQFFWHDYETFGISPRRDRPSQFAGIRTNEALEEVGEPLMIYCQPTRDYLPDPKSCWLTGITPQQCWDRGLPEPEFAKRIMAELSAPGTVGVGYNSIRFDDEVTRHLFWRNLLEPYEREFRNGCGRWDLLDVVRCVYALRPDTLTWPRHDDGRISFKLEHLSQANGLLHEQAHDALSDVRATIGLARLIRERNPRLWEFCLKLRAKQAVRDEIGHGRPFLHISGMYGVEQGCIALVFPLAVHPSRPNELIVWDLRHDPSALPSLSADEARRRLFTRQEDLAPGEIRLPIKTIHLNRSPVVVSQWKTLSDARASEVGIDKAQCLAHAQWLAEHGPALAGLWLQLYQDDASRAAAPADVDEDLYGGFLSQQDRQRLKEVLQLSPEALAQRAQTGRLAFDDPRLDELVFRFRARHHASQLDEEEQLRWLAHCQARILEGESGRSIDDYLAAVDELGASLDDCTDAAQHEKGSALLDELVAYAEWVAPEM